MARRLTGASFCTAGATVTGTGGGSLARSAAPPPPEQAERSPRPASKGASRTRFMSCESIFASATHRHAAGASLACGRLPLTTASGEAISLWPAGAGDDDAAGTQRTSVPPPAPSVDRQGRPRALDGAPLALPERGERAADGARREARAHVARAEPPRARAPRPPLPRVVPAHLAARSDLRGDPGRFPLVAGRGRALVRAARQERAAPAARALRAARRPAEAAAPPARPAARVHGERVHVPLAPLPEGAPPGPESRPDPRRSRGVR